METLWQEFKDRDVVLLGVNIDEPESVVEDFVNEFSLTYPVLLGNTDLKNIYNIGGRHISPYPRDYIVGTDGRIAYASAEFDPEQITGVVLSQLNPAPAIDPGKSDFNDDGLVDFGDFLMFAAGFGGSDVTFDIDEDGTVGFGDFLIFAQAFGSATRN